MIHHKIACLCPKDISSVFKIWEMVEEIQTYVDRLFLVSKLKKNVPIHIAKIEHFSILKPKVK